MEILRIIGIVYLSIGTLYGLYILLFQGDEWYYLPINIIFGPIVLVIDTILVLKKAKSRKL